MKQLFCFVIFEITCCTHLVEDLFHEKWFRISTYKVFASFVPSTKSWSLLNSPISIKIYYLKLLLSFIILFRFYIMYMIRWGLIPRKKVLFLLVCFPLPEKLGRSSYDITMTHYDVTPILVYFRILANAQGL